MRAGKELIPGGKVFYVSGFNVSIQFLFKVFTKCNTIHCRIDKKCFRLSSLFSFETGSAPLAKGTFLFSILWNAPCFTKVQFFNNGFIGSSKFSR